MSFTKLLNKTASIVGATNTTNSIGEVTTTYDNVKGLYKTRYEKIGAVKVIEGGYTTNIDDYLFFFNAGVDIQRNDIIKNDGVSYDIKQVETIYGRQNAHHIEVIATKRDHE